MARLVLIMTGLFFVCYHLVDVPTLLEYVATHRKYIEVERLGCQCISEGCQICAQEECLRGDGPCGTHDSVAVVRVCEVFD